MKKGWVLFAMVWMFVVPRVVSAYRFIRLPMTKTFIKTLFILCIILIGSQGIALSQSIPFETIDSGETSYYRYGDFTFLGAEMVISDSVTWNSFWSQHTQGMNTPPSVPQVDFKNEMVLVTMLGYQTSVGPAIEIASIEGAGQSVMGMYQRSSKGIQVFVKENRNPGQSESITNPYYIAKTSKSSSVIFEHQAMGNSCNGNADCSGNEYCMKEPGNCSGAGSCETKPQVCYQIVNPVCGCDGNSYTNECAAAEAGVSVSYQGSCGGRVCLTSGDCPAILVCNKNGDCPSNEFCLFPEGTCSGPGVCTPKPDACPMYCLENEICGCDMRNYCNSCIANWAGVSILSYGSCQK